MTSLCPSPRSTPLDTLHPPAVCSYNSKVSSAAASGSFLSHSAGSTAPLSWTLPSTEGPCALPLVPFSLFGTRTWGVCAEDRGHDTVRRASLKMTFKGR